jgi:RNA polymerase sigma-70 factor, ECF subfamily
MNKLSPNAVFTIEGRRVVAGEAILSGLRTVERSHDELLEALVRQHSGLVYRIAYAVLRGHHDAEDATQETFMRVLRYSSKLDEVEDPKTWLARIAWRVAVDRSRKRRWAREVPIDDPDEPVPEPESTVAGADETLQSTQLSAKLERLIAVLPEKLRQPMILSTIEEMTPREIAVTLGVNEAAVRSRVFRARQILKEKLAGITEKKL